MKVHRPHRSAFHAPIHCRMFFLLGEPHLTQLGCRRLAEELFKSATKVLLDNLLAVFLLIVGWLLGLVGACWSQNRSARLMRAQERRRRIYGPLHDELSEAEERLKRYADINQSKEYQRIKEEHILHILDVPNQMQKKIEQLYEDKLNQFNVRRRTLLKAWNDIIQEQLGIGADGNRLARMAFQLLKEWPCLTRDEQSELENVFSSAKRNYRPTLLDHFASAERLFEHFKKDFEADSRFVALTELRDQLMLLVAEIRECIRKDLK